jgi:hypothetical protein
MEIEGGDTFWSQPLREKKGCKPNLSTQIYCEHNVEVSSQNWIQMMLLPTCEDDWCGKDIEDPNVVDLTDDDILKEWDKTMLDALALNFFYPMQRGIRAWALTPLLPLRRSVSNPTLLNSPSIRYTALLVHLSSTSNFPRKRLTRIKYIFNA